MLKTAKQSQSSRTLALSFTKRNACAPTVLAAQHQIPEEVRINTVHTLSCLI